jgi:HECT-domain (ubiquitin-transferase)
MVQEGHIKIKVRREMLLQDAMDAVESIDPVDMRKVLLSPPPLSLSLHSSPPLGLVPLCYPLRVLLSLGTFQTPHVRPQVFRFEFIGEPALDAGGVAREFYSVICEQLFNPDCGLFLYSAVNQMCMQVNPNSGIANDFHLRYFHMCGRILGKALMDGQITPVHLVQPMYKHLMGWPVTLRDLEHIDDQVPHSCVSMCTELGPYLGPHLLLIYPRHRRPVPKCCFISICTCFCLKPLSRS